MAGYEYVLRTFGDSLRWARRAYESFVDEGVSLGQRPDLVGGGLIRSVGCWLKLKDLRASGIRIKGDERILGSSDFVERVLKQADEDLELKYRLQACGIDLETMLAIVAPYYEIESDNLKSAGKERTITKARTLLCYLAVRKLMISYADVARMLNISPATVSRAANRGPQLPLCPSISETEAANTALQRTQTSRAAEFKVIRKISLGEF